MTAISAFLIGIGLGALLVRVIEASRARVYFRGYADATHRAWLTTYSRPRGGYRC